MGSIVGISLIIHDETHTLQLWMSLEIIRSWMVRNIPLFYHDVTFDVSRACQGFLLTLKLPSPIYSNHWAARSELIWNRFGIIFPKRSSSRVKQIRTYILNVCLVLVSNTLVLLTNSIAVMLNSIVSLNNPWGL
jgi:hypothetical protein